MSCHPLLPATGPYDLAAYQGRTSGYEALRRVTQNPAWATRLLSASALTGLGGAHFPFAAKFGAALSTPGPRVVVCNAAEDEPGSRKDRMLLESNPHLVLEGALIAARLLEADVVYVYISDPLTTTIAAVERALAELAAAGQDIQCLMSTVEIRMFRAPPQYVAGEASAVVNAINGEVAKPIFQPPYPTEIGVHGRPTLVSNCETLANLPRVILNELVGVETLSRLVTVTGEVATPGVYEVLPTETTFADLIARAGGMAGSGELKAIQPGGPSGAFLDASAQDAVMTNASIRLHGAQPGCLAVKVFSTSQCMVEVLEKITRFFKDEQCGQCPACRMKTQTYHRVATQIAQYQGGWDLFDILPVVEEFVSDLPRRCALIDMPRAPLESARLLFADDFAHHIDRHSCSGQSAPTS
jgi:NADH-quinone oxidoreductase subunit F